MADASSPRFLVIPSARLPATLAAWLYVLLAGLDVLLLDGPATFALATAAVGGAGAVLGLLHRAPPMPAAWLTASIAVVVLAAHVATTASRPITVVLLALAAATAWAAVAALHVPPWQPEPPMLTPRPVPVVVEDVEPVASDEADVPEPEALADDPRSRLMRFAAELIDDAMVSLVEPDGHGSLVVTACTESHLVGFSFPPDSTSATERTYRTGERLFLPEPRGVPLVDPAHVERTRAASMLWEPVRVSDIPCAVLVVAWPDRQYQVPPAAIAAVERLAEVAAAFIAQESLLADLEVFSSTDVLTGLDSRTAWDTRLAALMASSSENEQSLAVAIIDLDHFRLFNQTYGQAAGDAHLARFASAARATLRCDGLIARWGDEEFSVALTAVTPEAAHGAFERVRLAVPDGRTCSIGFAIWDHLESGAQLLARADRGLHLAKDAGRNRTCQAN
jgi:diguanylate cyclase (GGDEF)-like protein